MLNQLVGSRTSVTVMTTSWLMEFETLGSKPLRYMLSSGAEIRCQSIYRSDQPIYDFVSEILEDVLAAAHHDVERRLVSLRFSNGAQLEFSNAEYVGGDNSAIVTNLGDKSWVLYP